MKRFIFLFFLFTTIVVNMYADDGSAAAINLAFQGHDDHIEYYSPADMPEAFFDSNDMEIIIVADGVADYYDVEIVSLGSMLTVIGTQVDGYGDSIDVSSLPEGDYRLVITSSNNNVYQGYFAIE